MAPSNVIEAIDRNEYARRQERRFLVSEEVSRLALRAAAAHLDIAHDDRPYQWSTTTYCDTYDWSIYRAAEAGAALRLRFREYHRTRPREILSGPRAWIELKDDDEETSRKERFAVSPTTIPAFLRGEPILPTLANGLSTQARSLVAAGAHPVVVTQYNRIAYLAAGDVLRVTADHNLMYFAVAWATPDERAVPARLGPVLAIESDVILELKWLENLPVWASDLLDWLQEHAPDRRPSKFIVAMRHLLGRHEVPA